MVDRLRVGVIGLAMASAPPAQSLIDLEKEVEVAGVFSPSPERRKAFSDKYGFSAVDSVEAIVGDASIDGVIVLTPPSTHLDLVRKAAAAGKDGLLEKPLENTLERSRELVDVADRAGISLGVVLQQRFRRTVSEVRHALEEGRLGEIVSVSVSLNNWRSQSYYDQPGRGTKALEGGGVLLTQAIHTLDQMGCADRSSFRGDWIRDDQQGASHGGGGCGACGDGVREWRIGATSATTAAYPGFPDRIYILTTKGSRARLDPSGALLCFLNGPEEAVSDSTQGSGVGADPMAFSNDNHRAVLEDFLAGVREGCSPKVSGREAQKAHRLVEATLRSSKTNSCVTF